MEIGLADEGDATELARLLWETASPAERSAQALPAFTVDVERWWAQHRASHLVVVARPGGSALAGMAWVALLPRPPRPGATARVSADLQSVFVVPEHRGRGLGAALVVAARDHARERGAARVTVHSGRRALPLYERLGFASSSQLLQSPSD